MKHTATLMFVIVVVAGGAATQTTHGDIQGKVSDASGTALPGVTISLASPALPGTHSTISAADGSFKFLVLPPGTYAATLSLSGYQTQQQANIKVGIDSTVRLNVALEEAFSGEIMVTSESPLVNITDTTVGADVSMDFFLDLPTDRNYSSVATVTPGVQNDRSGQTFYGSSGAENVYYIDGGNTTEIERGVSRAWTSTSSSSTRSRSRPAPTRPSTATLPEESSTSSPGRAATSSTAMSSATTTRIRCGRRSPVRRSRQGSGMSKTVGVVRSDYGADIGGYFVKDKLWFFAAYDRVDNPGHQRGVQRLRRGRARRRDGR